MQRLLTVLTLAILADALTTTTATPPPSPLITPGDAIVQNQSGDPIVSFNKETRKYHCPTCTHAQQCTKNCVDIRRSDAIKKGGVACKVCGGSCKRN